ncbi:MAG: Gfo/Idh/MocA family oxidoreductase [Spirochaetes bacterium]|nr:Gfo/Idh/MocA family oxidoreductase [Spirochaetota bacterium]
MDRIKLGIVGLGRLGRHHAENIRFRIPNAVLRAVCSVVKEELDDAISTLQPDYATLRYEELLSDPELDGIVIATNSAYHCEMICRAAEAGVKHIYCEKPLGMNQKEIDQIREAMAKSKVRVFQIGFNRRFDRSIREMKKKLDEGLIGKPILLKFTSRDPRWREEDLLRFSPSSGGLIFDMLTHDYDLARWFTGSEAVQIHGYGGIYEYGKLRELKDWDNCALLMRFRNGMMVFMETSRNCAYGYHAEIEAFGTHGALRMGYPPSRDRLEHFTPMGMGRGCPQWFFEYWEPTFQAELQHFVTCIQEGREPEVSLLDGYEAVRWALAATEAVRTGKEVTL